MRALRVCEELAARYRKSAVRTGDELAEIDAPELEQQVAQAQQQLAQSRASLGLAKTDLDRWKGLIADSAVTREEYDQKASAYEAASANTGAATANYQRLVEMQKFTRVRAPFAGVITARNVDIGSLISAAGADDAPVAGGDVAGAQGQGSLFRIAETDTVRTYISAPETQAMAMTPGLSARVTVQELPGRTFTGHNGEDVAIAPITLGSRTMLVEVDIANSRIRAAARNVFECRSDVPQERGATDHPGFGTRDSRGGNAGDDPRFRGADDSSAA